MKYKKTKAVKKQKFKLNKRSQLEELDRTFAPSRGNTLQLELKDYPITNVHIGSSYDPTGLREYDHLSLQMRFDPRQNKMPKCGHEMDIDINIGATGESIFGRGFIKEIKTMPNLHLNDFLVELEIVFTTPPVVRNK